jgi:hypothetical protein
MAAGYSTTLRNNQLDAITSFTGNAALVRVYDGTRPATGAAITSQVKLAEFTMATPFAPAASAGALSPTLPANTTGLAAGTATWFRIVKSDGTTFVMDGSVGTEMTLNTATFSIGVTTQMTAFSIARGNA